MAKFNRAGTFPTGTTGVITSEQVPTTKTYNGADGYARDSKGELFLLATSLMVGENTFYETSNERDKRYRDLLAAVVVEDPHWTAEFLRWLRVGANMRTAAVVGGIEAARALAATENRKSAVMRAWGVTPRKILDSVLQRADEPGEAIAYWKLNYGTKLPIWFKRGIGDAILRLYTPYSYGKWDSSRSAIRFADVVELSQISPSRADQTGLFRHILDARPGRRRAPIEPDFEAHPLLAARARILAVPVENRRELLLHPDFETQARAAGLTWEAISGWIQGAMDAQVWQRCIPLMPYGALLRNLANFDRAGIDRTHRDAVAQKLAHPAEVGKSRLLPMAFLTAYSNVPSDFWKPVLDDAATASIGNIPRFEGRTLVLIDTSSSMNESFNTHRGRQRADSERLMRWDVAALFGIALGMRCDHADVVSFSDGHYSGWGWGHSRNAARTGGTKVFDLNDGANLLSEVARFRKTHFLDGGTDTAGAIRDHYRTHNRVILVTDEQADSNNAGVFAPIPPNVPVYTFNVAGYRAGHASAGPKRHIVGGLSDAGFKMIHALETYGRGRWPWQE